MTKDAFMEELAKGIGSLPEDKRLAILWDYAARFRAAEEAGKSAEALAAELGDPQKLAAAYTAKQADPFTPLPQQPAADPPGAPYPSAPPRAQEVPEDPPAYAYAPPVQPAYTYAYTQPGPAAYGYPPARPAVSPDNQAVAVVLVVLFNLFIGLPLLFTIISILFGIACGAVALLGGGAALLAASGAAGSFLAGAAAVCAGLALISLAVLVAVGVILLTWLLCKGLVRYTKFCARACREGRWPS